MTDKKDKIASMIQALMEEFAERINTKAGELNKDLVTEVFAATTFIGTFGVVVAATDKAQMQGGRITQKEVDAIVQTFSETLKENVRREMRKVDGFSGRYRHH